MIINEMPKEQIQEAIKIGIKNARIEGYLAALEDVKTFYDGDVMPSPPEIMDYIDKLIEEKK